MDEKTPAEAGFERGRKARVTPWAQSVDDRMKKASYTKQKASGGFDKDILPGVREAVGEQFIMTKPTRLIGDLVNEALDGLKEVMISAMERDASDSEMDGVISGFLQGFLSANMCSIPAPEFLMRLSVEPTFDQAVVRLLAGIEKLDEDSRKARVEEFAVWLAAAIIPQASGGPVSTDPVSRFLTGSDSEFALPVFDTLTAKVEGVEFVVMTKDRFNAVIGVLREEAVESYKLQEVNALADRVMDASVASKPKKPSTKGSKPKGKGRTTAENSAVPKELR